MRSIDIYLQDDQYPEITVPYTTENILAIKEVKYPWVTVMNKNGTAIMFPPQKVRKILIDAEE